MIVCVGYPADRDFFKTCIWSIFKEPRDRSNEEKALEMVLFEELLAYHYSVAATPLAFADTRFQSRWFSRLVRSWGKEDGNRPNLKPTNSTVLIKAQKCFLNKISVDCDSC